MGLQIPTTSPHHSAKNKIGISGGTGGGFSGGVVGGTSGRYNETFGFDKMGNFNSLTRYENGSLLNNLSFTYTGNQLKKVDNSISPYISYGSEAFNDRQKITTEYYYDQNGSTTADVNSGISTIQYNLLNLPDQIQFTEGHKNLYTYNAGGAKLRAVNYTVNNIVNVPIGTISTLPGNPSDYTTLTTDYVGNVIYQNGSLKQIMLPEGYWQNGVFYYYLKDHLGDTRVVINSSGAIIEKSHYYPSGMRFADTSTSNSSALPFRYNGKEMETMNGLNQYDYGARRRGAGLPVWTAVDPLAEMDYSVSPYAYCAGDPVNFIDPFGLWKTTAGGYTTDDPKDIERFLSYLSVEKTALNNSPTINQMGGFVKGEMSDGGAGKLSDGSKLAPEISVKGYKSGSGVQWFADSKSVDNAWYGIQRDLTPYALDPKTLNQNITGSYPGPWNPKNYSGKDDYSYKPSNLAEIPAYIHDKAYDKIGIKGGGGLLTDPRAISADWNFVHQELLISQISPNIKTRIQALVLGYGLGILTTPKTIIYYLKYPFNKK